jgi:hypothetical protein
VTGDFWLDLAERAIKTFAQTVLATFGAGALDVLHADWGNALALGAGAALLSVLSSLLSLNLGRKGTASATTAVVTNAYADAVARGRHATGLADGPA